MQIAVKDLQVDVRTASGGYERILSVSHFDAESGAQIALVGGSGSGKTTFLHSLSGVIRPTKGSVEHRPRGEQPVNLMSLSEGARDRFRARHVGYVFQTFNLLQSLTALQNVAIAGHFGGLRGSVAAIRGEELLKRVGLAHRLHALPSTMSVGEQQRVAIARALVNSPGLLLADEPTASLDDENGREVLKLLRAAAVENACTLLLVTHEAQVSEQFETVLRLKDLSS
ncbi:MAG TPA: ABC transporter ATP-binding protein [Planctomycetota bacterium]|jgi:ABC-type lipoprotein export system ATPase subunit|nr:ABC transporter ATP-binding protein [Planctomycetota bacterium]